MRHLTRTRSITPLDDDTLADLAPGIFADHPHPDRSQRYRVINTAEVLKSLATEGFHPIYASQPRRTAHNAPFAKHMVVLRHLDAQTTTNLGDTVHEIVLTNAADGTAAYHLHYGLFRLACLNGMMVADSTVASIRVAHAGTNISEKVVQGSHEIIRNGDKIRAKIEAFKTKLLAPEAILEYARQAAKLRFPDEPDNTIAAIAPQLVKPRRYEDLGDDLWRTYQKAQESTLRGGILIPGRRQRTREITKIDSTIALNKALWKLTEDTALA